MNKEKESILPAKPNKKTVFVILSVFLCLSLFILNQHISKNAKTEAPEETDISIPEDPASSMDASLRKLWLGNKSINEDYIGQIVFDSGLIDLPFVQAKDVYKKNGELYTFYDENGNLITDPTDHNGNDVYIWTNWKTGKDDRYEEGGSVFMDFRNELNDQNLIIYGHHFARDWDPSGSKQFTPLDILLNKENYEQNKTLKLVLDNEIRSYVICAIFQMDIYDEKQVQILRTNMDTDLYGEEDKGFFKDYISYIESISEYNTGESLQEDDHLLTLVTCIQHQPEYRQIILCKETGIESFN